jgi:predicted Zn-dependent peptidase
MRVAIVDRPNATQTAVLFAAPGVTFGDSKRMPREMLNTILGGSFTSRLNQNLREEHGYTYGARSRWSMGVSAGDFSAGASVSASKTGASIAEFLKEFERLKSGDITGTEVDKARETTRNDMISAFEGLGGLLAGAAPYLASKLPFDSVARDLAALRAIEASDLNALAREALALDSGVLVLVGDKKVILEQLRGLTLPEPVEVDATGSPLERK